jgi:hypothetical protein
LIKKELIESAKSIAESETATEETKEAMESIKLAGDIVNSIMDGKHVDLGYIKIYTELKKKKFLKS